MFEKLCEAISLEFGKRHKGQLFCLPYTRTLLDALKLRGVIAKPLVVRAVVLGKISDDVDIWKKLHAQKLCELATQAEGANGFLQCGLDKPDEYSVPFRTLGYAHGQSTKAGAIDDNRWTGHLVAIAENTLIDMTIGQLNSKELSVNFTPTWTMIESDTEFEAGKHPIVGIQEGMFVRYEAFPDERSFERSKSWGNQNASVFRKELKGIAERITKQLKGGPLS